MSGSKGLSSASGLAAVSKFRSSPITVPPVVFLKIYRYSSQHNHNIYGLLYMFKPPASTAGGEKS